MLGCTARRRFSIHLSRSAADRQEKHLLPDDVVTCGVAGHGHRGEVGEAAWGPHPGQRSILSLSSTNTPGRQVGARRVPQLPVTPLDGTVLTTGRWHSALGGGGERVTLETVGERTGLPSSACPSQPTGLWLVPHLREQCLYLPQNILAGPAPQGAVRGTTKLYPKAHTSKSQQPGSGHVADAHMSHSYWGVPGACSSLTRMAR